MEENGFVLVSKDNNEEIPSNNKWKKEQIDSTFEIINYDNLIPEIESFETINLIDGSKESSKTEQQDDKLTIVCTSIDYEEVITEQGQDDVFVETLNISKKMVELRPNIFKEHKNDVSGKEEQIWRTELMNLWEEEVLGEELIKKAEQTDDFWRLYEKWDSNPTYIQKKKDYLFPKIERDIVCHQSDFYYRRARYVYA